MQSILTYVIIFLLTTSTALCQQIIEGEVVDKETGKPIPFASIGIVGTSKGTSSNLDGKFSLASSEVVTIRVTSIGYESLETTSSSARKIQLKSLPTQLNAVVVFSNEINPKKVVRRAFANIGDNYDSQPFLQKFFYRHYCMDDFVYGRLIEAFADVWKPKGYRSIQKGVGNNEEIRVTQLRRSLDNTVMAQGHEPMSVGYVLQSDIVGYQTPEKSVHVSFYEAMSNLKTDLDSYYFSFNGITNYDGQDVFEITYEYKKDSAQTTSGYLKLTDITGSLYIAMDTYTFLKTEETKIFGTSTVKTSSYYRKYDNKYYPYHFIREGKNQTVGNNTHSFHVELMSVEIKKGEREKFIGKPLVKEELLKILYDPIFWSSNSILKTTPLEDDIIKDLGGGTSLSNQFDRYHQYEINTTNGGKDGEQKFNWLKDYSKDKKILFITYLSDKCADYLNELESIKRLNKLYRNNITFVILSTELNEATWLQTTTKYNLFSDGIINYRIGENSGLVKSFQISEIPAYILIAKNGTVDLNAKHPTDRMLEDDFKFLIKTPSK